MAILIDVTEIEKAIAFFEALPTQVIDAAFAAEAAAGRRARTVIGGHMGKIIKHRKVRVKGQRTRTWIGGNEVIADYLKSGVAIPPASSFRLNIQVKDGKEQPLFERYGPRTTINRRDGTTRLSQRIRRVRVPIQQHIPPMIEAGTRVAEEKLIDSFPKELEKRL